MFTKLNLKVKLLVTFLLVGIFPFAIMSITSLLKADSALHDQAFAQMRSMRDVKKGQVERYLQTIKNQIITFSEDHMTIQAMADFRTAYANFISENSVDSSSLKDLKKKLRTYYTNDFSNSYSGANNGKSPNVDNILNDLSDNCIALQYHYIKSNPHPLGSKDALEYVKDQSQYSKFHAKYHPPIRNYLQKFGYYDIFLVEPQSGNIVYSVFKELDYATSLLDGPYAKTNFAKAFRQANQSSTADFVVFTDFEQYFPSYEAPAAFVASPIVKDGQKIGILVFQFPLDNLNVIMKERAGMGETGETYLVGKDLLMRSDSYLDPDNHSVAASFKNPEKGKVETAATKAALSGKTEEKIVIDYNNNPVLSAYTPLQFENLHWALLAEIDEAEAFAAVKALQWFSLIVAVVCIFGIFIIAFFMTRTIVQPVQAVVDSLSELSQGEGDLTTRLPIQTSDEIGKLAMRFNDFMEKLQQMIRDISKGIDTLSSSSTDLSSISEQMSANAEETSAKSNTVATAAEEMSTNMNSVSAALEQTTTNTNLVSSAAEEMTATINEIAESAENARSISEKAVLQTNDAGTQMSALGNAANAIGKVTETITEISEQTNLLALNATIEAARAGEAGKGFAVVANEIKELAKQTSEATLDIKQQIEGIQNSTGSTVQAIDQIGQVIADVNETVATIATAVEEQSVSTREIADNIAQVSMGTGEVNENVAQSSNVAEEITEAITEVNQSSNEMSVSSNQVNESAAELSQLAERLHEMAGRFKV